MEITINIVGKLQQRGETNSESTRTLHTITMQLADFLTEICPPQVQLPRGCKVIKDDSSMGKAKFLTCGPFWINGTTGYLSDNSKISPQTWEGSLYFAKDVSEGLLDEITAFLEARSAQANLAIQPLQLALEDAYIEISGANSFIKRISDLTPGVSIKAAKIPGTPIKSWGKTLRKSLIRGLLLFLLKKTA